MQPHACMRESVCVSGEGREDTGNLLLHDTALVIDVVGEKVLIKLDNT